MISQNASIARLNQLLTDHEISGCPVHDENDRVVGVVSQTDVVRLISKDVDRGLAYYKLPLSDFLQRAQLGRDLCEKTVREVMERRVHSISPDEELAVAAKMMRNLHIHRLLVNENDRPVGVLSSFDLLKVIECPKSIAKLYDERSRSASGTASVTCSKS